MALKLNSTVFGTNVAITASGERGTIAGFASYKRQKGAKQFLVEYVAGDGRFVTDWFFEDQLSELS